MPPHTIRPGFPDELQPTFKRNFGAIEVLHGPESRLHLGKEWGQCLLGRDPCFELDPHYLQVVIGLDFHTVDLDMAQFLVEGTDIDLTLGPKDQVP